jgi:SpoVK/Ycf46/Vps4 family AAA+-type ATPase
VGSPGIEKTLLIQAIAGETELKIITDNAHRYAMVYRGVAVGIKLLRDVFEALSLHTPCIFLLEDIHHIGERRPFLISDDENTKATEFGSEKEEIHEKNQVIYQLSKHFVSHYKKPYKGDFSLLIPTNHFCFNLFLGVSSPRTRTYQVTPSSPLQFGKTSTDSSDTNFLHSSKTKNLQGNILSSSLQIKSNQLLAPPATSPFSVLILKEEKKLKPKQIVKEMPWSGLPGEQLALISKANYSIRVKIALLADMALSNVSVKLDMITDLLVIIDSVKGNRGFIVFATTHLPYILDPALRRPGRFDETISLPLIPNLFSRWEILKANLNNFTQPSLYSSFPKGSTIDFTNISGIFSPNFELSKLSDKLVNFNKKLKPIHLANKTSSLFSRKSQIHSKNLTITYHLTNKQEPLVDPSQIQHYLSTQQSKIKAKNNATSKESNLSNFDKKRYLKLNSIISIKGKAFTEQNNMNYKKHYPKTFFNLIARTYFYISRIITYFSPVHQNSIPFGLNISIPSQNSQKREKKFAIPPTDLILFDSNIYLSLYASNETLKQHLTHLMAGKLGELFAFSNYQSFENQKNFENGSMNFQMGANFGIMSLYGIDKTWRSASSLLFSVITKRYLYNKNLITPKLLYFSNYSSLHEAPSPPSSNVLLPLKRYENYRRTFNSEQIKHKANFQGNALQATLELHQQQRLVKRLYKLPIREFFRSEIISDKLTGFGNSSITLSSVEKNITKPTNIHWYYRNRILNRHRNYLNTQWWNGQLSEHNAESTFLSDIDWRYTFVESIGDIFIDFPDSDQFYNARNRRWMLTSGSWNNWFNFEKTTLHEIYHQYTLDCFTKAYNSLDQQREVLDFYAFTSLNQCMLKDLKEITIMNIFKRFSQTS